jgi:hypothetical protein
VLIDSVVQTIYLRIKDLLFCQTLNLPDVVSQIQNFSTVLIKKAHIAIHISNLYKYKIHSWVLFDEASNDQMLKLIFYIRY